MDGDGNTVGIIEDLNARTDPVTFDLLDDIRIWVEDTGTYRESAENDFIIETGFSKALYVDIKVNALPVQVARIDLNPETFVPIRYKSNLNDPTASTPLRVYYDVSLDPAYLRYATPGDAEKQDKSKAVGVAMADISALLMSRSGEFDGGAVAEAGDGQGEEVLRLSAEKSQAAGGQDRG